MHYSWFCVFNLAYQELRMRIMADSLLSNLAFQLSMQYLRHRNQIHWFQISFVLELFAQQINREVLPLNKGFPSKATWLRHAIDKLTCINFSLSFMVILICSQASTLTNSLYYIRVPLGDKSVNSADPDSFVFASLPIVWLYNTFISCFLLYILYAADVLYQIYVHNFQ